MATKKMVTDVDLDASVTALATNPASALAEAQNATYARTIGLTSANATANTAVIQAALNQGGTVRIQCQDSDTALINNTLVVGSRTTVYVDCTLQLVIGATALPLWRNAAHSATPQAVTSFTQTAWDAVVVPPGIVGTITVGAHSLVVGDWVAVEGATTSGYNGVFSVIATTATTLKVLMPFTAAATTAAGTITFTKADTDITMFGGTAFQDGSNQTANPNDGLNCATIWHRIQGLRIDGMHVKRSRRYAWHVACATNTDLRNLRVENVYIPGSGADGVHLGGAVFNTVIDGVSGFTGDDFVSLTIGDYSAIQLSKGDFYNTRINNLHAESVKGEIVKLTGGSGQFYFKDTVIDGIGGVGAIFAVQVYDDLASGGTLLGTAGDRLVIKNVAASCQQVIYCNITGAFDEIVVDGVDANLTRNSAELVSILGASTVRKVSVSHVSKTSTASFLPHIVNIGGTAVVGRVDVQDCHVVNGGISGQYHYTVKQGGGTVTRVSIANCSIQSGGASGGAVFASSGGVPDGVTVTLRDMSANQLDYLTDFNTTATLVIGPGVSATGLWGSSRVTSKASGKKLTLLGGPILPIRNKADLVVSGGGLSDVYGEDLYLDGVQVTTPTAGSRFYNTNTSWSSGSGTDKSGMYAYNGSAWVKIYGPA